MWFNCFVQILALVLSFLPSAVILSAQYAPSNIYRSYTFCHPSLSLWFIKIFHWSIFFREKMQFEKMETFIGKFWFHGSRQELHWLFCWLRPEHSPRNQLMWSVGGNVMIEWAVDLLCLWEEISHFSGVPHWPGILKFNKQFTSLYYNLRKVIVMWNFDLKTTRSFKVPITL